MKNANEIIVFFEFTASWLSMDRSCDGFSPEMADLLGFLRTHEMKETELSLRREYHSLITPELSSPRSSVNVNDYFVVYSCLSTFILHSVYRIELMQFLFPIFVHFYLSLLEEDYIDECQQFYYRFAHATPLESLHDAFFYQLRLVARASKHLDRSPLVDSFRASRFFLRLSMTSCTEIQHYMDSMKNQIRLHSRSELNAGQIALLQSIFQRILKVDINKQSFAPSNTVRFQTSEQTMTPLFVHSNVANAIQFTRLYTAVFPLQATASEANRSSGTQKNRMIIEETIFSSLCSTHPTRSPIVLSADQLQSSDE